MTGSEFLWTFGAMLGLVAAFGLVHSYYNLRTTRNLIAKERGMKEALARLETFFPATDKKTETKPNHRAA